MGNPAARLTGMHTCPAAEGPRPHVGGPIADDAAYRGAIFTGCPAVEMGRSAGSGPRGGAGRARSGAVPLGGVLRRTAHVPRSTNW